ncbi:hypothetical protein [Streptomyces decoyicus]|uniref:hypothetical protein n=1 Tax=Streptomyces decoyicus TaxID=249567 RepID=UPI00339F5339
MPEPAHGHPARRRFVDHTRHTRPLQAERRIAELEDELDELRSANAQRDRLDKLSGQLLGPFSRVVCPL